MTGIQYLVGKGYTVPDAKRYIRNGFLKNADGIVIKNYGECYKGFYVEEVAVVQAKEVIEPKDTKAVSKVTKKPIRRKKAKKK